MPRLRVAVLDRHEVVVAGTLSMLGQHADRVELVDLVELAGGAIPAGTDVILYGLDESQIGHDPALHRVLRDSAATVIAFGWQRDSMAALLASGCGAHGFIHKQVTGLEMVGQVEQLHSERHRDAGSKELPDECRHPGIEASGLSPREVVVLSLIASGYSNREIATELFLSINTIKTFIRTAYQKIDVQRRSQAVIWARNHGLGNPREE